MEEIKENCMKQTGIRIYKAELPETEMELAYAGKITTGFASPAADYLGECIDINKLVIKNKDYTFIGKIEGDSMIDASLNDDDQG